MKGKTLRSSPKTQKDNLTQLKPVCRKKNQKKKNNILCVVGTEEYFLNPVKVVYGQITANSHLMVRDCMLSAKTRKWQGCPLLLFLFSCTRGTAKSQSVNLSSN